MWPTIRRTAWRLLKTTVIFAIGFTLGFFSHCIEFRSEECHDRQLPDGTVELNRRNQSFFIRAPDIPTPFRLFEEEPPRSCECTHE